MTEAIEVRSLLPKVFSGMEDTEKIRSSQIWGEQSFVIRRGCRICIQAESGSGKSTVAKALMGHAVGDVVKVQVPAGIIDFEIVKIEI